MNDDQLSRAIEEIEQGLEGDDPAFVRQVCALRRSEIATILAVFGLLAVGAVLLTVGVALPSLGAWAAGVLAYLTSFAIDAHHKHLLDRIPGRPGTAGMIHDG